MDFAVAVKTYHRPLSIRAERLTGDPVDAEDLLQSALLEAWCAWDSRMSSVWNWLKTILHRTWNHIRRDRSRKKRSAILVPLDGIEAPHAPPQHAAAELNDVLGRLRFRDTMVRVAMGFTATEIAEDEGVSRQAISQRIETSRRDFQ